MGWVLFGFTAPWSVVVGWGWVALMWAGQACSDLRFEEHGILTAEWRPWACRIWRYSTTLGRGIIYQPNIRSPLVGNGKHPIEQHERIHVRQIEDMMVLSFIVGCSAWIGTGSWLLGLAIWISGGAWQIPNFVTAWLRGGDPYRDSEHERSAYAQTDPTLAGGQT